MFDLVTFALISYYKIIIWSKNLSNEKKEIYLFIYFNYIFNKELHVKAYNSISKTETSSKHIDLIVKPGTLF